MGEDFGVPALKEIASVWDQFKAPDFMCFLEEIYVFIGKNLEEKLSPNQLYAAIAHELGHYEFRHCFKPPRDMSERLTQEMEADQFAISLGADPESLLEVIALINAEEIKELSKTKTPAEISKILDQHYKDMGPRYLALTK
jgi:Zn-dependent peptidase ImmA (M78 family)